MEKRKLSKSAWIAIACLTVAVLAVLYFFLVDRPVRNGIRAADEERGKLQGQLSLLQSSAEKVSGVADEVNSLTESGQLSWMPSYNSHEQEIEFLHNLLDSRTSNYQLSFSNVTRNENQIRRAFSLNFTTDSYDNAKLIIYRLLYGRFRCLISSVSLSGITGSNVRVNLSATFYETMVGGEPDMGLPENNRGEATDPVAANLIPSGVSKSVDKVKGIMETDSTNYTNLDDIISGSDGAD